MTRRISRFALSTLLLCLALSACRGSFGSGITDVEDANVTEPPGNDDAGTDAGEKPIKEDAGEKTEDASVPDAEADGGEELPPPDPEVDVQYSSNEQFDNFLTDREGRALYFYAGDAVGSRVTTCLKECAEVWPPFDANVQQLSEGLDAASFVRFKRDDGKWQLSYKERPLYYHSADEGTQVTGDGVDRIWFVARDYFIFFRFVPTILPFAREVQVAGTPYLTDGGGKTIYARLAPPPGGGAPALCEDATCLMKWPAWEPLGDISRLPIPSTLSRTTLRALFRENGPAQLAFEDATTQLVYPLHYNAGDESPGETRGQDVDAWRLIAPSGF